MCGIFGVYGPASSSITSESIDKALSALRSRGPDDMGFKQIGQLLVGHTRLSLLDMKGGGQPVVSDCGRYAFSFNGEIYNYKEMREGLISRGIDFKSSSDTEVIFKKLILDGVNSIPQFNGMFAFAFFDLLANRLILARDRFGIKPLFYSLYESSLTFSSLATVVSDFAKLGRKIKPGGVLDYLSFHTVCSPSSIFDEVFQLPPASFGSFEYHDGELLNSVHRYWTPARSPDHVQINFDDAVDTFDSLLGASVERQMRSDWDAGVFLSGGIDSSLLVRKASQYSSNIKTYSIKFPGDHADETNAAKQVSRLFSTRHTEIEFEDVSFQDLVRSIHALDQPLSDPAYIPTFLMSEHASATSKFVMTGDGADELFGGYPRYLRVAGSFPKRLTETIVSTLIAKGWLPKVATKHGMSGREMLNYLKVDVGNFIGGRKSFKAYFHKNLYRELGSIQTMRFWNSELDRLGDDTEALMKADWVTYLSENCLVKTDRASMAHGLEARVPFLDYDLVDFAEMLGKTQNFSYGLKSVPVAAAQRSLPPSVWDRPKHGFTVPIKNLMSGPWSSHLINYANRVDVLAPWFDADVVAKLLRQAAKGSKCYTSLAYSVLVFLVWWDKKQTD